MTEQEKEAWYETVLARANQAGAYAAVGGMQVVPWATAGREANCS